MVQWLHVFICALVLSTAQVSFAQDADISTTTPSTSTMEETASQQDHMQASLIFEDETIQPGHPFWVGIHLKLDEHWHSYWKNPGDAGMAPVIEWTLPEGFSAAPVIWPTPKKFNVNEVVGFGYEGEAILLAQITPPASMQNSISTKEPIEIGAKLQWVVCSDSECVLGESTTSAKQLITAQPPKASAQAAELFERARAHLPQKYEEAKAFRKDTLIELHIKLPADSSNHSQAHVSFYPENNNAIDHTMEPTLVASADIKDHFVVTLKEGTNDETKAQHLKGVLVVHDANTKEISHAMDIEVPISERADASFIGMSDQPKKTQFLGSLEDSSAIPNPANNEFEGGLGMALLFAFVGGMILNLMPCVLPVISFKILSFVKMAGQSRSLTFKHGLAFAAGVLISFWVLAGVLLILQTYGHAVGWGFQLQEPLFVGILAALLVVFSLSLFGIFEIGTSVTSWAGQAAATSNRSGFFGSFLSGVLATAVATPCTGPFLGTAVGYAVTLPALLALLIFTSLGLGMAFPYLVLAAYPKLLRFMPKPGPWMVTFKELMGFVMLASVLWLVWVFGAQTDSQAVFLLLAGFFCLTMGCWIYGKWGSSLTSKTNRFIGTTMAAACFFAGGYIILNSTALSGTPQESQKHEVAIGDAKPDWETFSPERIAELQSQGIPVIVDFTAKWCLICQANHLVMSSEDVDQKFEELGVVKMKADWTKRDSVITEALRKYGRNSVPLYLLFGSDPSQPPQILPQVLTQDTLLEYLNNMESK